MLNKDIFLQLRTNGIGMRFFNTYVAPTSFFL